MKRSSGSTSTFSYRGAGQTERTTAGPGMHTDDGQPLCTIAAGCTDPPLSETSTSIFLHSRLVCPFAPIREGTVALRSRGDDARAGVTSPTRPRRGRDLRTARWDGRHPGLEIWYQTVTDPRTGTGVWIHHELASVGPGMAELRGHIAVFPPMGDPHLAHFDPATVPIASLGRSFDAGDVRCEDTRTAGTAGSVSWDLRWHDDARPLEVFPRWVWTRASLDGAQIVPDPTATFEGHVEHPRGQLHLRDGRGAAGRIYGRGNPQRWGWLHADLGNGDVLEVVAAVSRLPLLRRIPPRAFVRLRLDGRDLPRWVGSSALTMTSRLGLPRWSVTGLVGTRRLRAHVNQPRDRCVEVDLEDPDGTTSRCVHSTRAEATILLEERAGASWRTAHRWELEATAHAEVGWTHG